MRKGGHRTWSDAPLPLGTVRIHGGKRRIKVNLDGPKSRQWKDYARFWWEQYRGEIPDAMRVVPLDGDPLNDLPENLALMTGGQFLLHLRRIRPRMKARNRRACSKATARFNRDMAAIRRARGEWPHKYFFPVNLAEGWILLAPRRMRWQALAVAGVAIDRTTWRFARRIVAGGPVVALRGSQLREERFRRFRVIEPSVAPTAR